MLRNLPLYISLWTFLIPCSLFAQTSTDRWAIAAGVAGEQFQAIGEQVFIGNTPYFPGAGLAVTRYLRPGFDFRTKATVSPNVPDPLSDEPSSSAYLSFDYAFVVKLNNGILFREEARIAPYLFGGAGGSYHAGNADAYSPVGAGLGIRTGERTRLSLEVQRKISWNGAPQTLGMNALFAYTFKSRKSQEFQEETKEISTEELIASQKPADSDGDGIPDTEDDCPYESGFIQNNGCPDPDSSGTLAMTTPIDTVDSVEKPEEEIEAQIAEVVADEPEVELPAEEEPVLLAVSPAPLEEQVEEVDEPIHPDLSSGSLPPIEEFPCGHPSVESVSFARNEMELSEEDRSILAGIAEQMKNCPGLRLRLTGFANEKSSADANLVLSIKRAYNIKYYLVYEFGISQSRIYSKGKGSESGEADSRSVSFEWSS